MDERGWHGEPYRHGLAARGIRTRAIVNPVAHPKWIGQPTVYGPTRYGPSTIKGTRLYVGSGLKYLDKQEIVDWVKDFVILMNQIAEEEGKHLGVEIQSVYLVGSRVSGFYTPESDLDVVVQFKEIPLREKSRILDVLDDYMVEALMALGHDAEWLLKSGDDEAVRVDLVLYSWEGPEEGLPHLKIWEAPS